MQAWIENVMGTLGVWGVAALMLLENVVPPLPSEVVMPLAGFSAARGEFSLWVVILTGSLGSLLGAIAWYFAGRWIGVERIRQFAEGRGRWLGFRAKEIDRAMEFFSRHGRTTIFVGRLIPAVRTFVSVPAGICGMPFPTFVLYTALGTLVWTAALAAAGYALRDNWQVVERYLGPISWVVLGLLVAYILFRVVRSRRESHGDPSEARQG